MMSPDLLGIRRQLTGLFALLTCVCGMTAHALAQAYIDDQAMRGHMTDAATGMIERDEYTPNDLLQRQLRQTGRCDLPAPPAAELECDAEDVYDTCIAGTLIVSGVYKCSNCNNWHLNSATGFVISEDGLAITNYHVVEKDDNETLIAATHDGRVVAVTEVLAGNKADDVALIRLDGDDFFALPVARQAHVGQQVHTISHPTGRYYNYSRGVISRFFLDRNFGTQVKRIGVTADYAKGSSGGPILNDRGQVVALVSTTNSAYFNNVEDDPRNLQMVFKNCVPYESILALFADGPRADAGPPNPTPADEPSTPE